MELERAEKSVLEIDRERKQFFKEKLQQLGKCEDIVSPETVKGIGRVTKDVRAADDNAPSSDELDEDLEDESRELNQVLDLPDDTYSLTAIRPELPPCVRYGVRAGMTHMNVLKFSPLSRGHQGGAIAIAAFATTTIYKSRCWNEAVIDQIVEDGDTFYCNSYKDITTDDRRMLSILDLKRELFVQNKMNVNVSIEDPAYAGKFRSQNPTELHLVKALDLFFNRYDAGILTSPVLNIAIWKDPKYYNIFDGQARKESCEPAPDGVSGTAKLFLVKDLIGVLFIILEKSNVKNEPFVIYGIAISGVEPVSLADDPAEPEKAVGVLQRRPSGYKVQEKFRAVVQGSYHMTHTAIPETLRGKGHLIIALAALVYSRLVNGNKWTTALIDLIFNQSNIYLVDLVRVLEKRFNDEEFELRMDDLMGDIILGVYSAKVKVRTNVIPGYGKKKGKLTIDSGIREFFETQSAGILEVKKFYYAIWKEDDTYYFMDPFACDDEGYRINYSDTTRPSLTRHAACVTMNSTVDQMVETILENTGNKDRDPFLIHGVRVLYVKTGITPGGPFEKVIHREKGTSRRPQAPPPPVPVDMVDKVVDMTPRIRPALDKMRDVAIQVPALMRDVDLYMMKDTEPLTYVVVPPEEKEPVEEVDEVDEEEELETETEPPTDTEEIPGEAGGEEIPGEAAEEEPVEPVAPVEPIVKPVKGYKVVNPNRLLLRGTINCLDEKYELRSRGKQGLITAMTALAYRRLKNPSRWRNFDIDQILDVSNKSYEEIIQWIKDGKPEIKLDKGKELMGEGEEEEEEEEVEGEEEEEEIRRIFPAPSHLDMTMLPVRLKLAEDDVFFKTKMKIIDGEANPIANLAEALECYFHKYSEVVLENKRLMYGIWKHDNKFFMFNPYGSDAEGWRLRGHPASFAVTDSLNELVDLLHGVLEFNDHAFILHFVALDSIQPGKYASPEEIVVPEDGDMDKFKTDFLPITDDDLLAYEAEFEADATAAEAEAPTEAEDVDEEEEEAEEEEEEEEGRAKARARALTQVEDKPWVDPLLEVKEQDQPDAPFRLNLILLTSNMKIYDESEGQVERLHDEVILEQLKYDHPPPYVMPSKKILATLLEAKRAKRSIHSLVSRFSIDSRLDVKKKGGFSSIFLASRSAIVMPIETEDTSRPSKLIKLSPKRYLYSRVLPICLMPLRAINDKYIQEEDEDPSKEGDTWEKKDDLVPEDVPEVPVGVRIKPELIPLGPIIKTPTPTKRVVMCVDKKKRKYVPARADEGDSDMEKILSNTEELLLELFFPGFKAKDQAQPQEKEAEGKNKEGKEGNETTIRVSEASKRKAKEEDSVGFKATEEGIRVIQGNLCLENRAQAEPCHFKSCFFAGVLCVLAKIKLDPDRFSGSTLDQFIFLGDKIYGRTGKLRYKPYRLFHNVEVLDTIFNVITKQAIYADPESTPEDELDFIVETFLKKHQTGIIVFSNSSYAFWAHEGRFYLFDPYACDDKGNANPEGYSCLMEFSDLDLMLGRLKQNVGDSAKKPFRLYAVFIAHMESKKGRKKRRRKRVRCPEKPEPEVRPEEPVEPVPSSESEVSLIEMAEWVTEASKTSLHHDMTIPGFSAVRNHDASMLDVIVLENEITTPLLAPFKKAPRNQEVDYEAAKSMVRRKIYQRTFKSQTAVATPLDLCVTAWALIHDPITWSVRTVRGLFEASVDYTFDSILAAEDSTVAEMTDGLLPEFEIANYVFRGVFAPIHYGTLYGVEGWNLSMSLQRLFETPSYSGAIIVCGEAHVGVTKNKENYFAWWAVRGTKVLRIVTSADLREFLRLIVKEIDHAEEELFIMRAITISYAQKVDPDCSDMRGLHESVVPATSLPEVHKKEAAPYDLAAIFRSTLPETKPVFVLGTVGLNNRDAVTEPRVRRCYFVAVLAVMVKRDIVQSPISGMVDKIVEVAESLYREFSEPKFHTEHILRNVTVMNRIFDFRDCASSLVELVYNPRTGRNDFYLQVKKHLKKYFKTNASGILHLTNCCYGFWYSRSTNAYYYIDPYRCNAKGRKVPTDGRACLCIFPSLCQMVKHMCLNQFEETTGFFIHRLHVDSINVPAFKTFKEDPMWLYLDYHWNFRHAPDIVKSNKKTKKEAEEKEEQGVQQFWNNYAVEVTNLIYSVWGTIGCYDSRFGDRGGKNQAAICVAVMAMQYLSHPSRWGPAILDSAVICGDSYYTESLRSSIQKCAKHFNKFNLQTCFKIFPHLWIIDFKESICGVLYGARNKLTLASGLKMAFEETPNVLIECNKITLAALAAKDGYYVADPCWIGPPLFDKDHGAIYVLRCRNTNSLVYAVTKMLNTNQRLEFRLTPISFAFEQQDINFMDAGHVSRKKILTDPVRTIPGKAEDGPVAGATVPDEDSYPLYRKNLALGIQKGPELENPELPSFEPILAKDNENNMLVSTTWHLNVGQAEPLKKAVPVFDPLAIQHVPQECEGGIGHSFESERPVEMSITELLAACDDYPRVIDFAGRSQPTKPLRCTAARSFLTEKAREEFRAWNKDMAQETYKTYQHRLPKQEKSRVEEEAKFDLEEELFGTVDTSDGMESNFPGGGQVTEATETETEAGTEAGTEEGENEQ